MVNLGPNATTFLLPAELYPTTLRASGHGLAAARGKLGAVAGVFLLPVLRDTVGLSVTVGVLAGACLLGLLVTAALGIETRGRSLAEASDE